MRPPVSVFDDVVAVIVLVLYPIAEHSYIYKPYVIFEPVNSCRYAIEAADTITPLSTLFIEKISPAVLQIHCAADMLTPLNLILESLFPLIVIVMGFDDVAFCESILYIPFKNASKTVDEVNPVSVLLIVKFALTLKKPNVQL